MLLCFINFGWRMMQGSSAYDWAVIGAGAAGIAALATLLDCGEDPKKILWFDPTFTVGDLSRCWPKVPANTENKRFLGFLQGSQAFNYKAIESTCVFANKSATDHSLLEDIVAPLQAITGQLRAQVGTCSQKVVSMQRKEQSWALKTSKSTYVANKVILAVGCEPNELDFPGLEVVSLIAALNPEVLVKQVGKQDRVAVFGSSHSAVLVMHHLLQSGVAKVVNFYQDPLRYARKVPEGIVHDNTGLKGFAADWAKANLEGGADARLVRYLSEDAFIEKHLPRCNKVVYAVGFRVRDQIDIQGIDQLAHCDQTGVIAPNLFGCGIAFPELKKDLSGELEHQVGLGKFLPYLQRVVPLWQKF
jgi:cation diffusion facilitator CzcD-associated flavoprotein CzcO